LVKIEKLDNLVNDIIIFCLEYGIHGRVVEVSVMKSNIEKGLKKIEFVESLINQVEVRTRRRKNIDVKRIKKLLSRLGDLRLDLEYTED